MQGELVFSDTRQTYSGDTYILVPHTKGWDDIAKAD